MILRGVFFTKREKKNPPLLFSSFPLNFKINSPPGASGTISALEMSQMVEILILDLMLIVNMDKESIG